jgi:hypothetical protein
METRVFTVRWEVLFQYQLSKFVPQQLRWLVNVLSRRRLRFKPGPVHVEFVVDNVALDTFFCEFFSFLLPVLFQLCSILICYQKDKQKKTGNR